MLSRVADGLFWISRYVERAENLARIADTYLQAELDRSGSRRVDWQGILQASGAVESFSGKSESPTAGEVISFLSFGADNPNSIAACLERARENARMIRDQITTEMWEELNRAWLELGGTAGKALRRRNQPEYFREVRRASHLFRGTTAATLSRGDARDFLDLGMFLERADATSRILEAQSLQGEAAEDEERWAALLRSCSARETYRAGHHGRLDAAGVISYLMLDAGFPRSLDYCLIQTGQTAHRLAQPADQVEVASWVLAVRAPLNRAPMRIGPDLARFLDPWQLELHALSDKLAERIIGGRLTLPERSQWHSQQEQQQQEAPWN